MPERRSRLFQWTVITMYAAILGLCGFLSCSGGPDVKLPEQNRELFERIKSDAKNFLEARLESSEDLKLISNLRYNWDITDLKKFQEWLDTAGIDLDLSELRIKEIAESLGVDPVTIPDQAIIGLIIKAAEELLWEAKP